VCYSVIEMQRTKKPASHREETTEQPQRLIPYDYGAYDTPEVFERMFPHAKAFNADGRWFWHGPDA
jgi:hypothetical protein